MVFLFANLIGLGVGPLAVGVVSDLLNPTLGQDSLRYALVLFCPGGLWAAFHFWKAANTIELDIRRVENESEQAKSIVSSGGEDATFEVVTITNQAGAS